MQPKPSTQQILQSDNNNMHTANLEVSARYTQVNEKKSLIKDERSYTKQYSPDALLSSENKSP